MRRGRDLGGDGRGLDRRLVRVQRLDDGRDGVDKNLRRRRRRLDVRLADGHGDLEHLLRPIQRERLVQQLLGLLLQGLARERRLRDRDNVGRARLAHAPQRVPRHRDDRHVAGGQVDVRDRRLVAEDGERRRDAVRRRLERVLQGVVLGGGDPRRRRHHEFGGQSDVGRHAGVLRRDGALARGGRRHGRERHAGVDRDVCARERRQEPEAVGRAAHEGARGHNQIMPVLAAAALLHPGVRPTSQVVAALRNNQRAVDDPGRRQHPVGAVRRHGPEELDRPLGGDAARRVRRRVDVDLGQDHDLLRHEELEDHGRRRRAAVLRDRQRHDELAALLVFAAGVAHQREVDDLAR